MRSQVAVVRAVTWNVEPYLLTSSHATPSRSSGMRIQ